MFSDVTSNTWRIRGCIYSLVKMASDAAKLLDELMGRDRNLAPTEKRSSSLGFEDPDVRFIIEYSVYLELKQRRVS